MKKVDKHIEVCVDFLNSWYNNPKLTKKLKPEYKFSVYNLDTKEILSDTYTWRYGYDHLKIKNYTVAEYYKAPDRDGLSFVSYDLETKQPKELYKTYHNIQVKYLNGVLQQKSAFILDSYFELPWDFIATLKDSEHIDPQTQVLCYGYKPYGRIVEYIDKRMVTS